MIRAAGFELPVQGDWRGDWPVAWYALPADSGAKTALGRSVAGEFAGSPAIVGVVETRIWPSAENDALFVRYRSAFSELRTVCDRPYHLVQADETEFLEGMFALSLYFIWGVILVNNEGTVAVRTSHDEWIEVTCKEQKRLDEFREILAIFGSERPQPGTVEGLPAGTSPSGGG